MPEPTPEPAPEPVAEASMAALPQRPANAEPAAAPTQWHAFWSPFGSRIAADGFSSWPLHLFDAEDAFLDVIAATRDPVPFGGADRLFLSFEVGLRKPDTAAFSCRKDQSGSVRMIGPLRLATTVCSN